MSANWRNVAQLSSASVAALAFIGMTSPASADGPPEVPQFIMLFDASNDAIGEFEYDPSQLGGMTYGTHTLGGGPNGEGGPEREVTGWYWAGSNQQQGAWSMTWECVVNPDPFVDATINVTNNSDSVQTFWVYMPLNIFPSILGGTNMFGSVSAVVQASSFAGATLSASGADPVFQAYIDGNEMLGAAQLWTPGYSLNAGAFDVASDSASYVNLAGPDAVAQIALQLRFDLSPGDSASITGIFEVQAIPAPAALALLGLAGVVGNRRRRG